EYLDTDAPVYHGPPLRCLQSFDLKSAASDSQLPTSYGIGRIVTPSAVDLFGDHRPVNGWITCPAVMDAVLYACGATIGRLTNRPSLPVCMDQLRLTRRPRAGETLTVVVAVRQLNVGAENVPDSGVSGSSVSAGVGTQSLLDAVLLPHGSPDRKPLAMLNGYRVGWIS
ncbi:MAG: hypothetical protein AAFN70_04325, partial [Planctomycetota bacterium]